MYSVSGITFVPYLTMTVGMMGSPVYLYMPMATTFGYTVFLSIFQEMVFAVVVPSAHLYPLFSVAVAV